jgi:uncharacterized protein (TIGR02246 family)
VPPAVGFSDEELVARLAILQLEGDYAYRWDSGDAEAWANLFTEDGVFEAERTSAIEPHIETGRHELRQMCERFHTHSSGIHVLGVPAIVVNGSDAQAAVHFHFRGISTSPEPWVRDNIGLYRVTYRHTDDGWRIAYRRERSASRDRWEGFPAFY